MEQQEINRIYEKYLQGKTTLDEEEQLKRLSGSKTSNEPVMLMQQFFDQEKGHTTDVDFRVNLLERFTEPKTKNLRQMLFYPAAAIVIAGILVLSTLKFYAPKNSNMAMSEQEALVHTKNTLGLVSHYLKKGTSELEPIGHVEQSFNYLKYLHTVELTNPLETSGKNEKN